MGLEDSSEDKKQVASGHDPRWKSELALKPFKSSIVGCEGKIFESDAVKNAAQFTKTFEAIADYVQINFNSDIAEAVWKVERPIFTMPEKPKRKTMINNQGKMITVEPDKIDIFKWKKDFEKQHRK